MSSLRFIVFLIFSIGLIVECRSNRPEECQLSAETGPCRGLFPSFFFNSATNQCETFNYGGCQGKTSNFDEDEKTKSGFFFRSFRKFKSFFNGWWMSKSLSKLNFLFFLLNKWKKRFQDWSPICQSVTKSRFFPLGAFAKKETTRLFEMSNLLIEEFSTNISDVISQLINAVNKRLWTKIKISWFSSIDLSQKKNFAQWMRVNC